MAFIIDDEYFHLGVMEEITQNIDIFNEASNGAIRLVDMEVGGSYHTRVFYDDIGEWSRRDPTSVSAIASGDWRAVSELGQIGVKLYRKLPIKNTMQQFRSSFKQIGDDVGEYSRLVGGRMAQNRLKGQVNDGLKAVCAFLRGQATSRYTLPTGTGLTGKITSEKLWEGPALLGDKSNSVETFVMHSKVWHDLMKGQVSEKLLEVTAGVLYEGNPATYGKRTLVTDSSALVGVRGSGSTAVAEYYTLCLTRDAVVVTNSEREHAEAGTIMEKENVIMVIQAEAAWSVETKGAAWDTANGGVNPSNSALVTTTNWDDIAGDAKLRGGAVLISL